MNKNIVNPICLYLNDVDPYRQCSKHLKFGLEFN